MSDTVEGFISAMESQAAVGGVMNLGSGFEVSIGDTARIIAELMGSRATISEDSKRLRPKASEVERLLADTRRARDLIGWKPRYGNADGFREGLNHTIAWFSDPANLARYRVGEYVI